MKYTLVYREYLLNGVAIFNGGHDFVVVINIGAVISDLKFYARAEAFGVFYHSTCGDPVGLGLIASGDTAGVIIEAWDNAYGL